MSEKKLYAVKNDEGEWMSLDGTQTEIWYSNNPTLFKDKSYAEAQSMGRKAHVVELVEPEKVVLTKEQAEIVENANGFYLPARYISINCGEDEELLMNAYVNGYTVEKEKKYNVKVPHTSFYYWKKLDGGLSINDLVANDKYDAMKFTEVEIEHYGLQDCEKEEVAK
ncbi:DUF1642 domain-containing protein [Lacticaseibacillus paracasei]|uniref:DUF1642 domain-containing protein n=1 Tax=Lacticaseibacillus paracasei TaxID=1597 RepID=UPI0002976E7A|nr:DUF1642 domain-containing protein [Lacticaseibacillus paracasei]EKQ20676.1 hypothetical protein LCAUW4_1816 [Lacticaseibacillus casei UW4]